MAIAITITMMKGVTLEWLFVMTASLMLPIQTSSNDFDWRLFTRLAMWFRRFSHMSKLNPLQF
jgi:hypothetical protein